MDWATRGKSGDRCVSYFILACTRAKHDLNRPGRWVRRAIGRVIMKTKYTVLIIAGAAFGAVATALIAIGFGVWAVAPTEARVPSTGQGIEPFQLMMNAKDLPSEEFADYTFVF
jgi:hypothetical protein